MFTLAVRGGSVVGHTAVAGGGYDKEFDGNSLLLEMPAGDCVHIGCEIFSFKPRASIEMYVSPVGNNNVPYPYAVDTLGNVYLFTHKVIITRAVSAADISGAVGLLQPQDTAGEQLTLYDDPNDYYIDFIAISPDIRFQPPIQPRLEMSVQAWFRKDAQYTLAYDPHRTRVPPYGYIIDNYGRKVRLGRRSYRRLMRAFERLYPFRPLKAKETYTARLH